MNPIQVIYNKVKNFFEADELTIIDNLKNNIEDLKFTISEEEKHASGLYGQIDDLNNEIKILNTKKMTIEYPEDIIKISTEIKSEYPIANICYKGYGIKTISGEMRPEVRVQDFIQVLNSHRKWVSDKGLTLQTYSSLTPKQSFGEVVNTLMFDIYKSYAPSKTYVTDQVLYGVDEQWSPSIDSWYMRKMDCENSTLELMSLFEAAGLTGELKSFYWNVCGQTSLGGHSTLYVWDFKNSVWRHIETTATKVTASDFYSLPTNKDNTDKLNVTSVWFSFNSDIARHTFKTNSDRESFQKRERFRNFIIK